MMKFVNLTPHEIVVKYDGETLKIPPSGTIARVKTVMRELPRINGIPVRKTEYGEIEGLPEPEAGTVYIVSILVLQALKGTRGDVVAPDTTPSGAIRDESGRIVAVKGFQVI